MASWLSIHSPKRFDRLAAPQSVIKAAYSTSIEANPPHLVIAGPAGVGKTALWRLISRQVLGPSWELTTHILQARDLSRQSGAMQKFENFLRPEGTNSQDTLAGRTSLTAFDRGMWEEDKTSQPPAGKESFELMKGGTIAPVSRLIVIEDADQLGPKRQPYLRRMMEREGATTRFIFTTKAPSGIIDAIRSRCQLIRIPSVNKETMNEILQSIAHKEGLEIIDGLLGDIVHISDGNLRKAIFTLELISRKGLEMSRSSVHEVVTMTTLFTSRKMIEQALRGNIYSWKWEQQGERKKRILVGALADLDNLMDEHALQSEDLILQIHRTLTESTLLIAHGALTELLESLAKCDVNLQRSMHARIQFENFLHEVSEIGKKWELANQN